ncbi:MAG: energy-coupling factor transporter ATPase [Firmicutes bacterium]|nr:energy-coupling factor transporter ATPase [Bacillota bacterium]
MIELRNLYYAYDYEGENVLNGLSLTFREGEWTAVIGANGSGKSTMARHINGLLQPDRGQVLVDGLDAADPQQLLQIRERVAFVFQNPDNQLVATTIEDDIAFGPENLGLDPDEIGRRVDRALDITGLVDKRSQAPHQLSGGEKQRVAIAGALAMASRYMILDEPTSMLDPQMRLQVIAMLQKLHSELGMGLIYVTNIMEEVLLAQRVVVVSHGRVVFDGTPREVFSRVEMLTELGLDVPPLCRLSAQLADAGYPQLRGCLDQEELYAALTALPQAQPGQGSTAAPIMPAAEPQRRPYVELEQVAYRYGKDAPAALSEFDLRIWQGQRVAVIGHSGSGKSTLSNLIAGLYEPSAGRITVAGQEKEKKRIFRKVGMVFQYPEQQLFAENVYEEVCFGARNAGIAEERLPQLAAESMHAVGLDLEVLAERSPFALSGGQKRRVCIAGVLAVHPKVLLLDEPTAGLDEGGRRWILELVRTYNNEDNTVIRVSHNMEEVAELAQRIVVLDHGRKLLEGTVEEVFAEGELLQRHGLDVPQAAQLVRRLRAAGYPLPGRAVTVEAAAAEILAWLGGGANA